MTSAHLDILRMAIARERMWMAHDAIVAGIYRGQRHRKRQLILRAIKQRRAERDDMTHRVGNSKRRSASERAAHAVTDDRNPRPGALMFLLDALGYAPDGGLGKSRIDSQARPNRTVSVAAQPVAHRSQIVVIGEQSRNQQHRMSIATRHIHAPENRVGYQHSELDAGKNHLGQGCDGETRGGIVQGSANRLAHIRLPWEGYCKIGISPPTVAVATYTPRASIIWTSSMRAHRARLLHGCRQPFQRGDRYQRRLQHHQVGRRYPWPRPLEARGDYSRAGFEMADDIGDCGRGAQDIVREMEQRSIGKDADLSFLDGRIDQRDIFEVVAPGARASLIEHVGALLDADDFSLAPEALLDQLEAQSRCRIRHRGRFRRLSGRAAQPHAV